MDGLPGGRDYRETHELSMRGDSPDAANGRHAPAALARKCGSCVSRQLDSSTARAQENARCVEQQQPAAHVLGCTNCFWPHPRGVVGDGVLPFWF